MKEEMVGSVSLYLWFPPKEEVYPVGLRTFWKVGRQKSPMLTFLIGLRLLHSSLYLLEDRKVAMLDHWLSLQDSDLGATSAELKDQLCCVLRSSSIIHPFVPFFHLQNGVTP